MIEEGVDLLVGGEEEGEKGLEDEEGGEVVRAGMMQLGAEPAKAKLEVVQLGGGEVGGWKVVGQVYVDEDCLLGFTCFLLYLAVLDELCELLVLED